MGRRILGWLLTASILLFAALFLLLGLGFHLQLADARGLAASGTRAEGTVTDLVAAKGSTAYRYSYQYPAAGRQFTAVNRSIPMSEREGSRSSPGA